jgi:tetratricopeptide (TPR) repeat protein
MIASGSFLALNNGSTVNLRIVLQFQDTHTGETVATFTQDGTQGDFLQLVSAGGDNLRHTLGIGSLSLTAAREARAAVPSNSAAERLYAQGLTQLQTFDPLAARALLEKAIAADPDHALSRSALAESLSALGYDLEAQAQAKKAVDLSANLSREDRLAIEGRYRELTHDRPAALEIYRTLHNFFPDNLDYGLRFARAQNLAGHPADALQTVAALRHLPPPQGQDARIDLLDASAYDRLGDMPRSQAAAAALRAQAQGSRLMLANAIDQEAWAWVNLGQPDKAIANDTRAREIWLAVGDPRHAAVALHGLAIYQHNKGDLPAAGLSFDEALKEFRRLGAQWDIASCSHNYGLLFFEEGDLVSAKQRLQEALQIQRALNDQRGVSSDLDDLGSVALSSGELPSAKQMKEQALQGFREMGDKRGQSVVLLNLGEVLYQQGDLSAATEKYNQAIVLQKEITRKTGLAHSFVGLAEVQMAQDRLDDARALAQQSLGLRQENKEDNHSAESNLLLAEIAFHQAKPAEAEVLARQALGVFEKNKTDASSSLAYSLLACALVAQRKIPDARAASDHAMVLARPNGDRLIRIRAALAAAEVANAAGQSTEAERDLNLLLSQVNREGYVPFVFQTRLLLAESELQSGKSSLARAHLAKLQSDARNSGFLLLARQASLASAPRGN